MNKSLPIWPWFLFLAIAGSAFADEVTLKNGLTLEGTVREDGKKVYVDVGSGTVTLDRSEVKSIQRPDDKIQEFDRRMRAVKPDDANGYYEVYLWARQQPGMKTRAESLLKKTLEVEPNHEGARRALGYVYQEGAWLTPEEYKARLGLVRYNGEWITAEAAERLKRIDQELMQAQAKRAAEEELQRQQLDLERERVAVRERLQQEMMRQGDYPRYSDGLGNPWALRYWGPAVRMGAAPVEELQAR